MDNDYKDHHIHVSVLHFADGWKPRLFVSWFDGKQEKSRLFTIQQTYRQAIEAEQRGVQFAQKWIADGKPELEKF